MCLCRSLFVLYVFSNEIITLQQTINDIIGKVFNSFESVVINQGTLYIFNDFLVKIKCSTTSGMSDGTILSNNNFIGI